MVFEREAREFLITSHFHVLISPKNITRIAHSKKSTLEYELDYDENLTRASRSNTGTYGLPRELFMEEFRFIVNSLPCALSTLQDCEVVGEFVHCLRILGVTRTRQVEEQDKEIFKLVDLAVDFLLDTEIQNGKCGEWVPRKRSTKAYDKYHAAYCGVVGLLDAPPPIPKDDNVLMKRWFMTLRARDNNNSE